MISNKEMWYIFATRYIFQSCLQEYYLLKTKTRQLSTRVRLTILDMKFRISISISKPNIVRSDDILGVNINQLGWLLWNFLLKFLTISITKDKVVSIIFKKLFPRVHGLWLLYIKLLLLSSNTIETQPLPVVDSCPNIPHVTLHSPYPPSINLPPSNKLG